MLRIGRITYANCSPIFHELQKLAPAEEYQFIGGVPAHLNALLAAGEMMSAPSSSIEYALHPERYLILPDLSISSIVRSGVSCFFPAPRLKSSADKQSCYCRIGHVCKSASNPAEKTFRVFMRFYRFRTAAGKCLARAPAILLIGDTALRASLLDADLLVYDLGELWYEWTGLPFVFALWFCGRKVAGDRPA